MKVVEEYLERIYHIRVSGAGVNETSYYGALERLFNEVGKGLKPKVVFILNLKNKGAGIPDGGFFTANQLRKGEDVDWQKGQPPERGAAEIKGTGDDVDKITASEQVGKYLKRYGLVLVTNLRDFLLVGQDEQGRLVKLERYKLGVDEKAFWAAVGATPQRVVAEHEEAFVEYLKRVMLHSAPLNSPVDLAWFLASYAKDARARVDRASAAGLPALKTVRMALEGALGLTFEGEKGDHFFKSTLVQTLFYGMFSAWVLWSKKQGAASEERFDWKDAGWELQVPVIRSLFEALATRTKLDPLGLVEVMDWAGATLNRVNRRDFFSKFEEEHAVQYFYEPFLEAFDPELRKDLGVWYTPPEIVKYMVERVDRVLREELGIEDGLADERVRVLDPACGTGAYLVEVLRRVARTLSDKGEDALLGYKVKAAAMGRVFGFEILPAPFVVAHLQMGLLLQGLGAPLAEKGNERAGVYLTNSLTGWGTGWGPKQFPLEGLEEEREAAHAVKRGDEILVVIGNPPYNAFAGVSPEQEQGLVEVYKEGLADWGITKNYLDDLYVRFFRLAERRITEMNKSGVGIVCFISNFSYLGDQSSVVMRQRFMSEFDELWFDCMNGDSRETGKLTPEGKPDPSVFSTLYNKEGIRVGTAIGLMVRKAKRAEKPVAKFRQFWGVEKREKLVASLGAEDFEGLYEITAPNVSNRFSFYPSAVGSHYLAWPTIKELCELKPMLGLNENRGGALQDIDRKNLEGRIKVYFDKSVSWGEIEALGTGLSQPAAGFDPKGVREKVRNAESFDSNRVVRYLRRPFDVGWAYISDISPLWNRSRPDLRVQFAQNNTALLTRPTRAASPEGVPFYMTALLGEQDLLRGHAYYSPILAYPGGKSVNAQAQQALFATEDTAKANLSQQAREYVARLEMSGLDTDAEKAALIWVHALAIGYAPNYLEENADGIRQDWPRVPLPGTLEGLEGSAELGREVAGLLDTESAVKGVTSGQLRPEMRAIGGLQRVNGGQLNPDAGDLDMTAGWGHGGHEGVTMPGKGKTVVRDYTAEEMAAIVDGATGLGLTLEQALRHLGESTIDVYLNGVAYWKNVPEKVWGYTIGGYQVMKKWLSYREKALLGRGLKVEEAGEVRDMARRIAAILLMEPRLNANYEAVKGDVYAWKRDK